MNEVEKLYSLAGVERKEYGYCSWDCDCPYTDCEDIHCDGTCPYWEIERIDYPPFTAEKQLELIKLLPKVTFADYFQFFFYEIKEGWVFRLFMITEMSCESAYIYEGRNKNFAEALAGLINSLWQDLTDTDKVQIKEILE